MRRGFPSAHSKKSPHLAVRGSRREPRAAVISERLTEKSVEIIDR